MLARMGKKLGLAWAFAFAVAVTLMATPAHPQRTGPRSIFDKDGTHASIESCVSHDTLEFSIGHNSALLDAEDRLQVSVALLQRYPMLQTDGFAPSHLLLWRRPGAEWVYVALLANPDKPSEMCFTATFAAGVFEQTPRLLKKYFASDAART